jgi:hypothetical protein
MSFCCEGVLEERQRGREKVSIYARGQVSKKQYARIPRVSSSQSFFIVCYSKPYLHLIITSALLQEIILSSHLVLLNHLI